MTALHLRQEAGPMGYSFLKGVRLTFFRADAVEVASREAASEGPVKPFVSALLVLNRLVLHRDGLSDGLIFTQPYRKQSRNKEGHLGGESIQSTRRS